jgi:hypothetical protein
MSMSLVADPVDRMHQAVLAAGVCINVPNAHFSTQWRVTLPNGTEAHFADTTGKRLIMRGLIDQDRKERPNGRAIRFVPIEAAMTKPPVKVAPVVKVSPAEKTAPRKRGRPKAVWTIDTAVEARQPRVTSRVADMTPWGVISLGCPPKRNCVLDTLEQIDLAVSRFVGRYESVPAEFRAEIMTQVYEPLLLILIQSGRRGQKTKPHRWV